MSSWHTSQLSYAFGLTGMLSFYGIVSVGVWILGDKFGYDTSYRIVIVAIVLLTLPFALIGGYVSARRAKKREAAEAAAAEAEAAGEAVEAPAQQNLKGAVPVNEDISQSTEEAVQFLKSSNLGAGKDAVYSLPWYIVAGTPKSGKSSLVLASGLNFQALPSQRQSEQKAIRSTKNVDWRVASEAVFLDTSGRYQTEGEVQEEWSAILEAIKKHRGQRPIDGMLMTVSAERILDSHEHEIEEMAKVMRTRIDEVMQRTKVRFPIYLVFTHADIIEGFRDSFSTSQQEGQNLVWGATIPIEKSENAQALFDEEFDLLQNSVMKRRLMRLSAPFPPVRQLKIFNFPLHFGAARKKLGHFVSTLFRPNPFSENPFLRGFYFTAVPISRPSSKGGSPAPTEQKVGQSYFAEKFFRDVVLRDKDLVATFQAQKVKPPIMGWLLTVLGTLLVSGLLLMSGISLYKNKQMVDEASRQGEAVMTMVKADAGKNPLTKGPQETRAELDTTDELHRTLIDLDNYDRNGAPIWMRFGLYSGNRLYHEKLLPTYFNAVEQRFKRPTVARIENDLRKFASGQVVANAAQLTSAEEDNLGKHYDLLKAYLMLSGDYRDKAESTFLSTTLAEFWKTESKIPAGSETAAQQQLEFYSKQIDRDEFPRIKLDANLVDATRNKLRAFPAVFRYYKRVTTEISKKVEPVTLESVLAGRSAGVMEGSHTVPGVYTLDGYRNHMKEAILNAEKELTRDDWVMGEKAEKAQAQGADIQRLQDKYFNDYTDNWRKFVRGINIPPYQTKDDAANALKAFSATESPMAITLKEVSRQTNLSAKPKSNSWWDWLMSFFQKAEETKTGGDTVVEREFRPLFTFASEDAKAEQNPISQYGNEIKKISDRVQGLSEDKFKQIAKDLADEKDTTLRLRQVENDINTKLEGFSGTSAGQELADLLRKPLSNLRSSLGAGIQEQIGKTWTEQILPKAKEAERGYPFEDSATEADLTKLTAYLNPVNGTLTKFYSERLEKYFEESNGQLKVKDTSEVKFSPEFVAYLNNAFRLRETLFGKSATAAFEYEFKLQPVKDSVIEVKIDGQVVTSSGTSSTKFKFPAGSATETGAFINFASTAEPSGTSGKPLPTATPAASNTNTSANTAPTASPFKNFLQSPTPSSGSGDLKFPGTWGLFRFFQAGSPKKSGSGEYILTYKLGGKTITATVRPSGGDLFDRSLFTSAKAPQNFLK